MKDLGLMEPMSHQVVDSISQKSIDEDMNGEEEVVVEFSKHWTIMDVRYWLRKRSGHEVHMVGITTQWMTKDEIKEQKEKMLLEVKAVIQKKAGIKEWEMIKVTLPDVEEMEDSWDLDAISEAQNMMKEAVRATIQMANKAVAVVRKL